MTLVTFDDNLWIIPPIVPLKVDAIFSFIASAPSFTAFVKSLSLSPPEFPMNAISFVISSAALNIPSS